MNLFRARLASLLCFICLTCAIPAVAGEPAAPEPATEQAEPPKSKMETGIIGILIFLSVISLGLIVERGMALRHETVIPSSLAKTANHCRTPEELLALRAACNERPSPHGRLLVASIEHLDLPREENAELLQTRARGEVAKLERGVVVLEIITGIGPLLGLVGTLFGLITLFHGMGIEGTAQQTPVFAQGISIALNATLLGLVVAIPSLVAWSYFNRRIETLAIEMESLCDEFLRSQYQRTQHTGG